MIYAKDTDVTVERSEMEIKAMLRRYGATEFASGWTESKAVIKFRASDRLVRFELPLPSPEDRELKFHVYNGKVQDWRPRGVEDVKRKVDQACRQRFRALALVIKAKLEAVQSEIASFEEEFYAHIVMPGGKTVYQMTHEQVKEAYLGNRVPQLELK